MSQISTADRDYLNSQLREAAIVIDDAERAATLRNGEISFRVASASVRGWRRFIESTPRREIIVQALTELDEELSLVGGNATEAVGMARRFVGDVRNRLVSARE